MTTHERCGPYQLVRRIALGGMAEVFEAEHEGDPGHRACVVKRMLPALARISEARNMFAREARLGNVIHHPNIVRTMLYGESEGRPYLVLEHVDGVDLSLLMRNRARLRAPLPIAIIRHVMAELLGGIYGLHEARDVDGTLLELVHRDVSPNNVLLSITGEVKLADLGIARPVGDMRKSSPASMAHAKGKLGYLAPEQVRGDRMDHRVDIFAAGVIAAELAINAPLFTAPNELGILLAIRDGQIDAFEAKREVIPDDLFDAVSAALAVEPTDRPPTADALRTWIAPTPEEREAAREALGALVTTLRDERFSSPGDTGDLLIPSGPRRARIESGTPSEGVHLARGTLIGLLGRAAIQQWTGRVTCTRGPLSREVFLQYGSPQTVRTSQAEHGLGRLLTASGILSGEELARAEEALPRFEGDLAQALISLNLVEPVTLFQRLGDYVRDSLLELFLWQNASATFAPGRKPPATMFRLDLEPWELLDEGIRGRMTHGLDPELEHAPDRTIRRVAGAARVLATAPMPTRVLGALSMLEHPQRWRAAARAITDARDPDPDRPHRTLALLWHLELIEFC